MTREATGVKLVGKTVSGKKRAKYEPATGPNVASRATETLLPTVIQISQLSNATDLNSDLLQKVAKLRAKPRTVVRTAGRPAFIPPLNTRRSVAPNAGIRGACFRHYG